jgi:hypothetical protein
MRCCASRCAVDNEPPHGNNFRLTAEEPSMILLQTTLLLICSNIFLSFAWYAHLRNLND